MSIYVQTPNKTNRSITGIDRITWICDYGTFCFRSATELIQVPLSLFPMVAKWVVCDIYLIFRAHFPTPSLYLSSLRECAPNAIDIHLPLKDIISIAQWSFTEIDLKWQFVCDILQFYSQMIAVGQSLLEKLISFTITSSSFHSSHVTPIMMLNKIKLYIVQFNIYGNKCIVFI